MDIQLYPLTTTSNTKLRSAVPSSTFDIYVLTSGHSLRIKKPVYDRLQKDTPLCIIQHQINAKYYPLATKPNAKMQQALHSPSTARRLRFNDKEQHFAARS